MRNERMYTQLLELITTDSAGGKERQIAEKLRQKMMALGFTVEEDDAGSTFGGECGNLLCPFFPCNGRQCGKLHCRCVLFRHVPTRPYCH